MIFYPRIFKDESLLNEMLSFRRQGLTYDQLAIVYNVDRTTIKHWCDHYQLGGEVIRVVKEYYKQLGVMLGRKPNILVIDGSNAIWVEDEIEGRICLGKSYQEYLEQSNPTRIGMEKS